MKRTILWFVIFTCITCGPACDNLVNNLGNYENMSASDTADSVDDIIGMEINSTDGALTITFDESDLAVETDGVHVEVSGNLGCIGLEGGGFFPYGALSWEAGFDIVFNNCTGSSGSVYNGTLHIGLSGPLGSVNSYDFTGRIDVSGPIDGKLDVDLSFNTATCIFSGGWDCWDGTVNGYSIAALNDAN